MNRYELADQHALSEGDNGNAEISFLAGYAARDEEVEKLKAELKELKGLFDLSKDEYINQVGSWKIIQRLQEENEKLKQQLEIAETTLAKASPDYFNLYQKIIDDIEHENVENE